MGTPVGRFLGKSVGLLELYVHHRAALQYDLQARFGWGVERIENEAISWNDAWDLVSEIIRDPYSHCCAAVAGFSYVPTPEDVRFYDDLDVQAMRNRGKNAPMPKPVKRPWASTGIATQKPRTPEADKRRERLNERLGLAS